MRCAPALWVLVVCFGLLLTRQNGYKYTIAIPSISNFTASKLERVAKVSPVTL